MRAKGIAKFFKRREGAHGTPYSSESFAQFTYMTVNFILIHLTGRNNHESKYRSNRLGSHGSKPGS